MKEILGIPHLEKYRDPNFPFFYWIAEPEVAIRVVASAVAGELGPFGLETGFGKQPSRLFYLDGDLTWLLTESDSRSFNYARDNLNSFWWDLTDNKLINGSNLQPVIALQTPTTPPLLQVAKKMVFRNPDYRYPNVPSRARLQSGQNLLVVVDEEHIYEFDYYKRYFTELGYDSESFVLRPDLSLSMPRPGNEKTYALEVSG